MLLCLPLLLLIQASLCFDYLNDLNPLRTLTSFLNTLPQTEARNSPLSGPFDLFKLIYGKRYGSSI